MNQFDPFKDQDTAQDVDNNMKEMFGTLVNVGNLYDKLRGLPSGQTKVALSLSISDLLTAQVVYARNNKNNPAVSDGSDSGFSTDNMDEQVSICSIEFIEDLVLLNDLRDLTNKEISLEISIENGQKSSLYKTTITTGKDTRRDADCYDRTEWSADVRSKWKQPKSRLEAYLRVGRTLFSGTRKA